MSQHWFQRAAEHSFQKRCAYCIDTIFLFDQWPVEIGSSLLAETQRLFPHQSGEEGLNGFGVPGSVLARQCLDDLAGGTGRLGPNHFHDFPFCFGNARNFFHLSWAFTFVIDRTITSVIYISQWKI